MNQKHQPVATAAAAQVLFVIVTFRTAQHPPPKKKNDDGVYLYVAVITYKVITWSVAARKRGKLVRKYEHEETSCNYFQPGRGWNPFNGWKSADDHYYYWVTGAKWGDKWRRNRRIEPRNQSFLFTVCDKLPQFKNNKITSTKNSIPTRSPSVRLAQRKMWKLREVSQLRPTSLNLFHLCARTGVSLPWPAFNAPLAATDYIKTICSPSSCCAGRPSIQSRHCNSSGSQGQHDETAAASNMGY